MFARIVRLIHSFFAAAGTAAMPLKALTGLIVSIIVPYLLYAFLGGIGIALAAVLLGWALWWLATKNRK